MRSAVSLILIPLCLLGQVCCPHAHWGTGVEQTVDHHLRPHIHLGGRSHHPHPHPHRQALLKTGASLAQEAALSRSLTWSPLEDHDHDALYLNQVDLDARVSRWSDALKPLNSAHRSLTVAEPPMRLRLRTTADLSEPPERRHPLPCFLLWEVLRI